MFPDNKNWEPGNGFMIRDEIREDKRSFSKDKSTFLDRNMNFLFPSCICVTMS